MSTVNENDQPFRLAPDLDSQAGGSKQSFNDRSMFFNSTGVSTFGWVTRITDSLQSIAFTITRSAASMLKIHPTWRPVRQTAFSGRLELIYDGVWEYTDQHGYNINRNMDGTVAVMNNPPAIQYQVLFFQQAASIEPALYYEKGGFGRGYTPLKRCIFRYQSE